MLESKRDANQVSGPYVDRIKEYISLLPSEAKGISFSIFAEPDDFKLYFATFNAYGADKESFCKKPVIGPEHLNQVFSDCVALGWQAFEKETYNFFKSYEILINGAFEDRVKDYKDFDQLKEIFSQSLCEFENPDGLNPAQTNLETIENILGKPFSTE